MNFRKHAKGGNLFSAIEHQQKVAKKKIGVLKLKDVIDWSMFSPVLKEITASHHLTTMGDQLEKTQRVVQLPS